MGKIKRCLISIFIEDLLDVARYDERGSEDVSYECAHLIKTDTIGAFSGAPEESRVRNRAV